MGALKPQMAYAGSLDGPEGQLAPNLTPDDESGIGRWSVKDIAYYLQTGSTPDGDEAEGLMSEMIEHGFSRVAEADLMAVAAYEKTLKPIFNKVKKKK